MNYVTEKEMKQRLHISAVIHTERKKLKEIEKIIKSEEEN